MINCKGNMFEADMDVCVVTTNGFVKANGEAVMGRGCAKLLADMFPYIPARLGTAIKNHGNNVHILDKVTTPTGVITTVSMPVKPASVVKRGNNVVAHAASKYAEGSTVPGFHAKANYVIIARSLQQLIDLANAHPEWKTIVMPRPGCGAGELQWEQVEPMLQEVLDDRFHVYTF